MFPVSSGCFQEQQETNKSLILLLQGSTEVSSLQIFSV
uniref:PNAS-130 n=1 Tax=Homo sapiens TaxID=9606 RepID=Q9BXV7_HUMAN|nr:PNAS-130 [Homo sapiens]